MGSEKIIYALVNINLLRLLISSLTNISRDFIANYIWIKNIFYWSLGQVYFSNLLLPYVWYFHVLVSVVFIINHLGFIHLKNEIYG